jgi:hypothetical protein
MEAFTGLMAPKDYIPTLVSGDKPAKRFIHSPYMHRYIEVFLL